MIFKHKFIVYIGIYYEYIPMHCVRLSVVSGTFLVVTIVDLVYKEIDVIRNIIIIIYYILTGPARYWPHWYGIARDNLNACGFTFAA